MATSSDPRVLTVGAYPTHGRAPAGGVEMAHYQLVRALSEHQRIRSHVITARPGNLSDTREDLPWASVRWVQLRSGPLQQSRELARYLGSSGVLSTADVIHVQGDARLAYQLQLSNPATPIILTVHGIAEADARLSGKTAAFLRSLVLASTEGKARLKVKNVVAISNYTTQFLDPRRQNIFRIGNPVAPQFYNQPPTNPQPNSIFFVGRIRELKNVLGLIDAFHYVAASVTDSRLHIVGPGLDTLYGARCVARVAQLGLTANVTFHGSLETDRTAELLRTAAVAVQPSFQENAPMAICEAAALGVPVVTSDAGDMREMVEQYGNGLTVPVGDTSALGEALITILREGRTPKPNNRLAAVHTPAYVARETAQLYERLLEKK